MRFHEREKTLLNNCGYLKHTKLQDLSEFVSPHTHIYAPGSPTQTYDERIQNAILFNSCLLYTSPSPRDATLSRMPSSA